MHTDCVDDILFSICVKTRLWDACAENETDESRGVGLAHFRGQKELFQEFRGNSVKLFCSLSKLKKEN